MTGDAPYRESQAVACARCQTPLPATGTRDPWRCDRGCGEWLSLAAIDEHLCPQVLDLPQGGAWWKPSPGAPPCAMCGQAMQTVTLSVGAFHRCTEHGVWFDKKQRDDVSHHLAGEVAQHRQARELVALLRRGDEASLRAFARRFVSLEVQLAMLRRELGR